MHLLNGVERVSELLFPGSPVTNAPDPLHAYMLTTAPEQQYCLELVRPLPNLLEPACTQLCRVCQSKSASKTSHAKTPKLDIKTLGKTW